jgi:hypothetical protein
MRLGRRCLVNKYCDESRYLPHYNPSTRRNDNDGAATRPGPALNTTSEFVDAVR